MDTIGKTEESREFFKSMTTFLDFPASFEMESKDTELKGETIKEDEQDFYVTTRIPILKQQSPVYINSELKESVEILENTLQNLQILGEQNLSLHSVPIYVVFACQKRLKKSKAEIEKIKKEKEHKGEPFTDEDQYYKKIPDEINPDGFIYTSFHISILVISDGKLYTIGYGLDMKSDETEEIKMNSLKLLLSLQKMIKTIIPSFANASLFGTGVIFTPDSLDVDDPKFNYKIIDVGLFRQKHIIRLNKMLSLEEQLNAHMLIIPDDKTINISLSTFSAKTTCIYSRLSSRYLKILEKMSPIQLPILLNCSSFAENIFYDSINCSQFETILPYSDPNKCKKTNFEGIIFDSIFTSYFDQNTKLKDFLNLLEHIALSYDSASMQTEQARIEQARIDQALIDHLPETDSEELGGGKPSKKINKRITRKFGNIKKSKKTLKH